MPQRDLCWTEERFVQPSARLQLYHLNLLSYCLTATTLAITEHCLGDEQMTLTSIDALISIDKMCIENHGDERAASRIALSNAMNL